MRISSWKKAVLGTLLAVLVAGALPAVAGGLDDPGGPGSPCPTGTSAPGTGDADPESTTSALTSGRLPSALAWLFLWLLSAGRLFPH